MPSNNLIVNGNFEDGLNGWSGSGLEIGTEDSYLGNGSSNMVLEFDERFQSSFLSQDFHVPTATSTTLTMDVGLSASATSGFEGFIVNIVDSTGGQIASTVILPTTSELTTYSLPVTFPSSGTYTIRFSELGADDGHGTVIDNVAMMFCFAAGTLIETPQGLREVQTLEVDDVVTTARGLQTIRWVGRREVSANLLQKQPNLAPVRIRCGALGDGLPFTDLLVSRQHRILVESPIAKNVTGTADVLIPAIHLTEVPGCEVAKAAKVRSYHHIMFDAHEVIFANGLPCESFLPARQALAALSKPVLRDLLSKCEDSQLTRIACRPVAQIPEGTMRKKIIGQLAIMNKLFKSYPKLAFGAQKEKCLATSR